MSSPKNLTGLAAAAVLGALAVACRPHPTAEREVYRPVNLLLITIDTMRADAVGLQGGRRISPTPTLDRLATGGVRFTDAHAHNVVTLPSHANILTGQLPPVHGVHDNGGFRLGADRETLATRLRQRGYRTGAFVSAFPLDSRFGLAAGFDTYDDRLGGRARPAFLVAERPAEAAVGAARAWIDATAGAPWFAWVHVYEPHFPYAPPPRFAEAWPDDRYIGEVAAADAALAPLLDPILAAGTGSRTMVIVTSDHGEALGEHGEASHGVFAYESVLRVPLLIYGPGLVAGRVVSAAARHVDLVPTALDMLGLPIPEGLAGETLRPAMNGAPPGSTEVYFEALSASLTRGWAPLRGILHDGVKFIDLPLPELYDLTQDPGEVRNLIAAEPARADALRARLERIAGRHPEVRPTGEPAEVRERLRSLGYAGGGGAPRAGRTSADDPKHLIALDAVFQQILEDYLRGDLPGALERSRQLVLRRPSMAVSWMQLGQLEREAGNASAAVRAMRRAVALRPGDPEPLTQLGANLIEAGDPRGAAALLAPHARQPHADPDLVATAALAQTRIGRIDEARALLARALREDPSNPTLMLHLGTLELSNGRRAEARRAFDAAVALDPGDPRAHGSLGALAIEDGQPERAAEHWRAAVRLDAREYGRILALGIAMARAGRPTEARACLAFFAAHAPESRYAAELSRARAWLGAPR